MLNKIDKVRFPYGKAIFISQVETGSYCEELVPNGPW